MKSPFESAAVLDRGGKPSVRELLSSLVFNPVDGTIRLNGDRLVMQRAAVGSELRRELVRLLGREEARVFLIRLGFLSGQADARFVRAGWPGLDVGDAFTAGTRLHMFSGVVRVETVHNDFDFSKKRFLGEFLWHDSVEAAEFRNQHQHTSEPVCWTQLGYASGYASQFFDTLIVYKEVECAAEGHRSCRVIGKPAEMWGAADPDVAMFREHVTGHGWGSSLAVAQRSVPQRTKGFATTELDRVLLAPVQDRLDRLARTALPVLVVGAPGTGRLRAAQYLSRAASRRSTLLRIVHGSQVTGDLLAEIAAGTGSAKRGAALDEVVIDDLASVPVALQPSLARAMTDGAMRRRQPVIALLACPPSGQSLSRELWLALSPTIVTMPTLASRPDDLPEIAKATLAGLVEVTGGTTTLLEPAALTTIADAQWPGNLPELRAVLAAVLLDRDMPGPIPASVIRQKIAHIAKVAPPDKAGPALPSESQFDTASLPSVLSINALERHLYKEAITRADGNLSAAARSLGLTRAQLAYRIAKESR
jgi:Activator of aromatic catabolism/V4R domain/Bacterial regulatory protein, Fis family/Sigma-54 interaction domain